jgi:integrase/recombinase XerD
MNNELTMTTRTTESVLPAGASDEMVINLWLKQHGEKTQPEYRRDIRTFFQFTDKQLREITLLDLQDYKESLAALAKATIARRLGSVKSLLTFCHKTGYTSVNVGAALRSVKVEEKLAERIMSEAQMQRILALETNQRNHAMLRLMYNTGIRVSEVCAITWNDLQERKEGAQIRVFGKGEKECYILLSEETYAELI